MKSFLTLLWGAALAVHAAPPPPSHYPVDVRLVPGAPLTANLYAPEQRVIVRNTTTLAGGQGVAMTLQAVVLRDVHWAGTVGDTKRWHVHPVGSTREEADGTVSYQPAAARRTELAFETGLLLPGEEIEIALPLTPQREEKREIVIEFGTVSPDEGILLPRDPAAPQPVFAPISEESRAKRKTGALALVRATSRNADTPLKTRSVSCAVELKLTEDATFKQTGGMSSIEAARRAGVDGSDATLLSFYRPELEAWFFTRGDGSAAALVKEPNPNAPVPPTAPPGFKPKDYKWTPRAMPRMQATVPELLGAPTTSITPQVAGFFQLKAPIAPADLWRVLEAAEKGKIEVQREEATTEEGVPASTLKLVFGR